MNIKKEHALIALMRIISICLYCKNVVAFSQVWYCVRFYDLEEKKQFYLRLPFDGDFSRDYQPELEIEKILNFYGGCIKFSSMHELMSSSAYGLMSKPVLGLKEIDNFAGYLYPVKIKSSTGRYIELAHGDILCIRPRKVYYESKDYSINNLTQTLAITNIQTNTVNITGITLPFEGVDIKLSSTNLLPGAQMELLCTLDPTRFTNAFEKVFYLNVDLPEIERIPVYISGSGHW